jgi:hypothetical protein
MTKRARFTIAAMILALAYVGSYYATVERGWPGSKIAEPDDTIYCPPEYRVFRMDGDTLAGFFVPMHKLDAFIRYDHWHPIVRDLAEEARRSGKYTITKE